MAAERNASNSHPETRSSVSFTFHKRTDLPKVNLAAESEEKEDYVLSLVGNKIERLLDFSKLSNDTIACDFIT